FAFASELKSLLQLPEIPREIDARSLEQFGALFDETMRQHLFSDVPVGAFLSGGVDSSAVVAMMHQCGATPIQTFSIGYENPESELRYARIVAERFRTEHHPLVLTPAKFRELLPRIVWYMDEPVGDQSSLPFYFMSEFARKRVTVALSGEGSDEIFAGYPNYRVMLAYETVNRIPLAGGLGRALHRSTSNRLVRRCASRLGRPLEQRYRGVTRVFEPDEVRR
ncbi:MAG: asparagine synthase, partial [bacterium]|nr:asparagine synthase [bacterium]